MKKLIIFFVLLVNIQCLIAQKKSRIDSVPKGYNNIETTVIDLDLSRPEYNSVEHSGKEKSLVAHTKNPIAFRLSNGNPFRYRYVLDFKKVNLFSDVDFSFERPDVSDKNAPAVEMTKVDGEQKPIDELQGELEGMINELDKRRI